MIANAVKPIRPPRIIAIDFMRIFAVLMVVLVHILTQPVVYSMVFPEALLMLLHVSREIFFTITGLVLTYTSGKFYGLGWFKFYWRRFPLVLIPYITWTLIYILTNGTHFLPFGQFWNVFMTNIQNGDASYQLYFLIVSLKLYLIFPLLYPLLKAVKKYHVHIIIVSGLVQLLVTAAMRYGWGTGVSYLVKWFADPDEALISYQFYLLAGCIAAWHMEEITNWVRAHFKLTYGIAFISAVGALISYWWQLNHGSWPLQASEVFQPAIVVESVTFTAALFALGVRWVDKGAPHKQTYLLLSDVSFGIYLCHVLVLSWVAYWTNSLGVFSLAVISPVWVVVLFLIVIITPLVYVISALGMAILRRTPLSLCLSGRSFARKTSDEMKPTTKTSVAI